MKTALARTVICNEIFGTTPYIPRYFSTLHMTSFCKSTCALYDDAHSILFQRIDFGEALVVNVAVNGVLDTTFEAVPKPAPPTYPDSYGSDDIGSTGPEPKLLVGNHANLKVQVVASEIAKLLGTLPSCLCKEKVVFSMGLKWLGTEPNNDDFNKVMFLLENLKLVLL